MSELANKDKKANIAIAEADAERLAKEAVGSICLVHELNVGEDFKALRDAAKKASETNEDLNICFFSKLEANDKVVVVARAAAGKNKLDANEWVTKSLEMLGGGCGYGFKTSLRNKRILAYGEGTDTRPPQLESAMREARNWARFKLRMNVAPQEKRQKTIDAKPKARKNVSSSPTSKPVVPYDADADDFKSQDPTHDS